MTRILVQRGSTGAPSSSSSNHSRSSVSVPGLSSASTHPQVSSSNKVSLTLKDEELAGEVHKSTASDELRVGSSNYNRVKAEDASLESLGNDQSDTDEKIVDNENISDGAAVYGDSVRGSSGLRIVEVENEGSSVKRASGSSCPPPPPPPVPPLKPASPNSSPKKFSLGSSNALRIGSSSGIVGQTTTSSRTSPAGSRPSSPRSHCESEGYNSADEEYPKSGSSCDDVEREFQFEMDMKRVKGLEVKKMREDGNCLFRAVANQVYGDSEAYDLVRQMCIDYMERERDHFSQFITEGFTSYCKRKRRDKVYGNNVEIQALSEMYNRPIHIYSYSMEPINMLHGSYNTDSPPIRLSYHHGNHYNSLVDPRRLTIGAGLGFSCLRGRNIGKDQVKAAIKAQQDQQIDNALLAEGRFYSELELTEKEIERMVIEASRAEYVAHDKFTQQLTCQESSTSSAEPSSSGARSSGSEIRQEGGREIPLQDPVFSNCVQIMLSMGFSYQRVIEAYSIFGDDVDSMVCYLIETSSSSRRKGKATE